MLESECRRILAQDFLHEILEQITALGQRRCSRDAQLLADYTPLWTNYERRALQLAKQGVSDPQLEQFRWLLEELRVNLFAQELRTPVPVSVKRLQKMWEGIQYG